MEQSHKENGVSVVGIIVGIGVVGVLIALASAMFSQNLSSLKLQQEASTAEELRGYLAVGRSAVRNRCSKTRRGFSLY